MNAYQKCVFLFFVRIYKSPSRLLKTERLQYDRWITSQATVQYDPPLAKLFVRFYDTVLNTIPQAVVANANIDCPVFLSGSLLLISFLNLCISSP